MPYADINGIRLNYSSEGKGVPMILLTGFSNDIGFWKKAVDMLSDRYEVICLDNRGAGKTVYKGGFSMDDLGDDVVSLMEHLNISRAHILGWSMGSHIAQNVAIRYPKKVATLTLVSSYHFRPARSSHILRSMINAVDEGMPSEFFSHVLIGLCNSESFFERKEKNNTPVKPVRLPNADSLKAQLDAVDGYDTTKTASSISCPTLSIHGTEDIMVDCKFGDALAESIKDCKILRVEGAGHVIDPRSYIPTFIDHVDGNPF
jgi:Predicted hydrolases or acyltransferases (alpha/beta hydrolase superfamily)